MAANAIRAGTREPISRAPPEAEPSAAFTPGPWDANPLGQILFWRESPFLPGIVAYTAPYKPCPSAEDLANARLIAAAPDLYEALKQSEHIEGLLAEVADLDDGDDFDGRMRDRHLRELRAIRKRVSAALAKAAGQ